MSPMSTFFDRLVDRHRRIDSLLCVGLDPRVEPGASAAAQIVDENRRIIDATIDTALCYKPNIAFYEQHGPAGLQALADTIRLIGEDVPVILDAKRGDIGSTAEAYAAAVRALGAGAVTVSPYMGSDSVLPFVDAGLAVFVLCKTSNPGSNEFQTLAAPDLPLYRAIAAAATAWSSECGLVVGATDRDAIAAIRAAHPEVWILAPGIGAQGATMRDTVAAGARADGAGILPVVARGIAAADDPKRAAADLVDEYRRARDARRDAAAPTGDATVTRLLDAILDTNCFQVGEFTLKSGTLSPFYIDLRRLQSSPDALEAAAAAYRALFASLSADRIAAVPVAAISLATAFALSARLPLVYPRLPPKPHGSGNTIEGNWSAGERVVLVDDLITTGLSKIEAIDLLRGEGLVVDDLLVLIERGAQGRRDMERAGVRLHAAASIDRLVDRAAQRGLIDAGARERIVDFLGRE